MNQSRVIHYDRRRLPKEKRSIRVFGAASYIDGQVVKDQSDKIWRCWNCGMICNELHDNIKLGDGVGYTIKELISAPSNGVGTSPDATPGISGTRNVTFSVETMNTPHLMKLASDGSVAPMEYDFTQYVTSGCPLCGTRNYR